MKRLYSLLLAAAPLLAAAQTLPPDLKALIGQAVEHSPAVRQGILQEQATRLRTQDARSGTLPQVSAGASYTYLNPVSKAQFGPSGFQFAPYNVWTTAVNARQTLLDFGRTRTAIEAALEQEASARTTTENFRHLVSYQTAQVYYGVVFLTQSIAVQDTILRSLGENLRTTVVKIRQGEAIDLDRLNTQTQIDNVNNRRTDLQNQLARQMATLRYLTGGPAQVGPQAQFDFRLADTTGLGTGTGNYDVKLAQNQVRLAERASTLAGRAYYPSLEASASTGFKNGYLLPWIKDDAGNFDAWRSLHIMRFNVAAGGSLNIPIYNGGRTDRGLKLARLQTASAKLAEDDARDAYRRDLTSALADRDGAALKLRNAGGTVAQAQRALQLAQSRYRNGVATNLEVLTSNDLYQQARLAEVNARYQLTLAELEIARLSGYTLR